MRETGRTSRERLGERNPFEKMSFRKAFESQVWREYLECVRTTLPYLRESAPEEDLSKDLCQLVFFDNDGDFDEEAIMLRFRDLMLSVDDPERSSPPLPGLMLRDFLNSLGSLEVAFWRTLPLLTIERVIDGEIPISSGLSEQISKSFGTRSGFWWDMQREYDQRKSGLNGSSDSNV